VRQRVIRAARRRVEGASDRREIMKLRHALALAGALSLWSGSVLAADMQPSLYKRLGGYDALAAVTDDFVGRLATDPKLSKFFVGHSTDSLHHIRQLVLDQLCAATGGPCYYIGRDMKTAHAGLHITDADWDISVMHLKETLAKFMVPAAEQQEVVTTIASLKPQIVEMH
jgi:hemoglobin